MAFEPFIQLMDRIRGYLVTEPQVVLVEFLAIWVVVYIIFRFMRGTRGARVIKGAIIILIVVTIAFQLLGQNETFERLNFLYSNFITFASLVLIVVFQPELRRALVRLGEARWFGPSGLRKARVVDEIVAAVDYLARHKIGALIAIERQVGLRGLTETGTPLNADISRQLIQTIFWPGSALHDLGTVLRGDRIAAAAVQFPLSEASELDAELGSRHRAAIGLTQECDALVVVVSEETGTISIAERGRLERGLDAEQLRTRLVKGMATAPMPEADANGTAEENMTMDEESEAGKTEA